MHDQFNVDLEDSDLLNEVELSIALMIAATESVEHLSRDEIDDLLGVKHAAPDSGLLHSQHAPLDRRPR